MIHPCIQNVLPGDRIEISQYDAFGENLKKQTYIFIGWFNKKNIAGKYPIVHIPYEKASGPLPAFHARDIIDSKDLDIFPFDPLEYCCAISVNWVPFRARITKIYKKKNVHP